ncbi:hypothetical protein NQZ79_g1959 [Umbelopsis isabellina]|nr:hypothetical protein NQZ79_g1959 [Umbelopsis isabellina]
MSTGKAEKLKLPDKEFLNVEYPGRVNNVDKALNNIGGIASLTRNHKQNSKEIELKFRPNDPFSHGIVGNVVSTKNLLLKVTRQVKKSNPEEQVGDVKAEILGQIRKTCRFRGLADFQFLVPPENRIAKVKKAVVECDVDQMMQFNAAEDDYKNLELVPPPLFTRLEFPFDYSYQQNPAVAKVKVRQPDGTVAIRLVNRYKQRKAAHYFLQYEAQDVPDGPPSNFRPIVGEALSVLPIVTELFEERPVWTRFALRGRLPPSMHKFLPAVLPAISYNMISGPWRDTWIRYGYNPKKHKDSYLYQLLDQRMLPKAKQTTLHVPRGKRRPLEPAEHKHVEEPSDENDVPKMNHRWDGQSKPEAQNNYMLCDILLPDIQDAIHLDKYRRDFCAKECGWYYPAIYKDLRKVMKAVFLAVTNDEPIPTLEKLGVNFNASLESDIASERQAKEAEKERMDTDESAIDNAASAGPDVSARVDELMRTLANAQGTQFEDELNLEELEEYDIVFGDEDEEDEDIDELGDIEDEDDQIDELDEED